MLKWSFRSMVKQCQGLPYARIGGTMRPSWPSRSPAWASGDDKQTMIQMQEVWACYLRILAARNDHGALLNCWARLWLLVAGLPLPSDASDLMDLFWASCGSKAHETQSWNSTLLTSLHRFKCAARKVYNRSIDPNTCPCPCTSRQSSFILKHIPMNGLTTLSATKWWTWEFEAIRKQVWISSIASQYKYQEGGVKSQSFEFEDTSIFLLVGLAEIVWVNVYLMNSFPPWTQAEPKQILIETLDWKPSGNMFKHKYESTIIRTLSKCFAVQAHVLLGYHHIQTSYWALNC